MPRSVILGSRRMLAPSITIRTPSVAARWLSGFLLGLALFVSLRPVTAVAHEVLVLGVATGLAEIESSPIIQAALRSLPSDPVYTRAVLSLVGDIQGAGVAITGPIGTALHLNWPSLFLPPDLVSDGAWTSALILPGSTVMARGLSFLAADVTLLALGWAAWRWALAGSLTTTRFAVATSAGALQAHIIMDRSINARISLGDVEALGLPFAFSALFSGSPHDRPRITSLLLQLPESVQATLLGLLLALAAFTLAVGSTELGIHVLRCALYRQRQPVLGPRLFRSTHPDVNRLFLVGCALVLGISPLSRIADADTRVLSVNAEAAISTALTAIATAETSAEEPQATTSGGPSTVSLIGNDFRYLYLVDGAPVRIKGIGYNVRYAHLPLETRIALYDRDFALMREVGVNTVFGWETAEFDRVTLDRAWASGLGVAPPFDLRPDLDYTSPEVRAALSAEVLQWVAESKDHPAVRMWAVGNEVLHKLVFPSWMSVQAEGWREARAQAFAAFLVDLTDGIHRLDPNHPVIHRDAEDAYVRHVREAFARDGLSRPWFVYGVNVYTPRIGALIERWPEIGLDAPLFVSEFAPGGLGTQDRPAGLHEMWDMIQDAGDRVIGGAVYAWSVDGPEEVDRVFGLVDPSGFAVDGALDAVASMYGGLGRGSPSAATPGRDEAARVRQQLRVAIATAQETGGWPEEFGRSTRSVARVLDELGGDPVRDEEIQVARVSAPVDEHWDMAQEETRSWWVTWSPSRDPEARVGFLVDENIQGGLRVTYACRGVS